MGRPTSTTHRSRWLTVKNVSLACLLIWSVFFGLLAFRSMTQYDELNKENIRLSRQLDVLTGVFASTFNALEASQIARTNPRLRPGWVTRVFPRPRTLEDDLGENDVGRFVMDEKVMTLLTHENHDIQQPTAAAYLMNSLFAVESGGPHQFGVQVAYDFGAEKNSAFVRCRVVMLINRQQVLNQTLGLSNATMSEALLTGSILVPPGMAQAELMFACTQESRLDGNKMKIRIKSRAPGDAAMSDNGQFMHFAQSI